MELIDIIKIAIAGVVLFILCLFIRLRYYKKIVEIQDEVCLDLLNEAAENNRMMLAMGLVSEDGFEKQKEKLIDYTNALIRGGYWGNFLHKKSKKGRK